MPQGKGNYLQLGPLLSEKSNTSTLSNFIKKEKTNCNRLPLIERMARIQAHTKLRFHLLSLSLSFTKNIHN
jgi:hypothetical protein